MPVLVGPKSEGQKFPGAVYTLCIEAMMQDGKALQAGTSHFLGQNFAKAFDVKFQNQEGKLEYAWATSWGVSHAADRRAHHDAQRRPGPGACRRGWRRSTSSSCRSAQDAEREGGRARGRRASWPPSCATCRATSASATSRSTVKVDDRDQVAAGLQVQRVGAAGVPVRVELGPKDLAKNACVLARRDLPGKEGKELGVPLAGARRAHRRACSRRCRRACSTGPRQFRDANTLRGQLLRRVQEEDRGAGRLPAGPLGRHARDGGPHRRRDQGDDPLHPVRPPEGSRASAW